ncbi:MarR family transcriptional regulator [Gorillibacterium sp. CAU 1737]|uniref:MarR family winged helix-turn-helix transcriptional regulator n=1 Tax=Gorillibacterium sp. CAU 1737 TaxID=3140362 RepID=UPI003260D60C
MEELQEYVLHLPLANEVFFALVETTAKLVEVSEQVWQSHGLNGARIRVMVEIMKAGGTLLPSELAQRIGVTKANISLLLIPLERDGFIHRAVHPQDGRMTLISITEEGKSLLMRHLPENRQRVSERMQALEAHELKQLLVLVSKLRESAPRLPEKE